MAPRSTGRLERRERWRRVRIGVLLAWLLALVAGLLYWALFLPVETPYIAVIAPAYEFPLGPHGWAAEDLAGLEELDGRTLEVLGETSAWRTRERGLADLERRLDSLSSRRWRIGALVIHVSMLGALDGSGRPCLVPPDASPIDEQTWLPLADLFRHIEEKKLPPAVHKLIVLDCTRSMADWKLGQLYNGFVETVPAAVAQSGIENLVVLTANSPGEQAWQTPELRGTVFGHYLRLGIAGAADLPREGGNDDDRVTLRELHAYLLRHVDPWTRHYRDARQRPAVFPSRYEDFEVAWSLDSSRLAELMQRPELSTPAGRSVAESRLRELWQAHDELAKYEPLATAPLAWCRFEQQLLWLEAASNAGSAYAGAAAKRSDDLLEWTRQARARAEAARSSPALAARASVLSAEPLELPAAVRGRSLPMAQLVGTANAATALRLRSELDDVLARPGDAAALAHAAAAWNAGNGLPAAVETHLMRLLERYRVCEDWNSSPAVVAAALRTSATAESLAALQTDSVPPADLRAHAWVRSALQSADDERRAGLDTLLAGQQISKEQLATKQVTVQLAGGDPLEPWRSADAGYAAARRDLERYTAAYRDRDRALAYTPWLARWLTQLQPLSRDSAFTDRDVGETLMPLVSATQRLCDSLSHAPPYDEPARMAATVFDDHAQVQSLLGQLEAKFASHCDALIPAGADLSADRNARGKVGTGADVAADGNANADSGTATDSKTAEARQTWTAATLRDIQAALRVPLIPYDKREQLWKQATRISEHLHSTFDEQAAAKAVRAGGASSKNDVAASDYLEQVAGRWQDRPELEHPALALLAPYDRRFGNTPEEPPAGSDEAADADGREFDGGAADGYKVDGHELGRIASDGRRLRDILLALPMKARELEIDESADQTMEHRGAGALDHLTRAACGFSAPELPEDPAIRVWRGELQQLLIWHARRALDDTLGPAAAGETPFFQSAAEDYLAGAASVLPATPPVQQQLDELRDLLALRRKAARDGLVARASDVLLVDVLDDPTALLAAQAGSGIGGLSAAARPVMMLRQGLERIGGTSRLLDMQLLRSGERQVFDLHLDADQLAARGPLLEAVAVLRGNEFTAPVLLKSPRGLEVAFDRHVYGPPRVTVYGQPRKRPSIEFILDCSNSMSTLMNLEAPGGAAAPRVSRLDVAKIALAGMLDKLTAQGNARVGVRLFGHRVGRNRRMPQQLLRQNGYARASDIPPELQPYEDVEAVLPLGRFDTASAESVKSLMKSVVPWGETPLYLSITQALGDMDGDDADVEKSIVVITDGGDDQTDAPTELAPSAEAVKRAWGEQPVRLFIVGFGLDAPGDAQNVAELTSLADATGGRYFPARSAQQLITWIEELLGPSRFRVKGPDDFAGEGRIGRPLELARLAAPTRFAVSFDAASDTVELHGGEAVELETDPSGTRLTSVPRRKNAPRFAALVSDATSVDPLGIGRPLHSRAIVEQPFKRQGHAHFPVWLESSEGNFVPRPGEIWVEVEQLPLAADQPPRRYVFYDTNFEPGTPAPLLDCVARNWPADVQRAEVGVWVKYGTTRPAETVPLDQVADLAGPAGRGFPIAGVPGITYRVRRQRPLAPGQPLRVGVVEWHDEQALRLDALKIELDPPADHVEHLFDAENRLVVHTFSYRPGSGVEPRELRFTRREDLHAGALRLAAPLEVDVFNDSDTVELTPPQ